MGSSNQVPGFLPSVNGLHFGNSADQLAGKNFPVVTLPVVGPITASAGGGICGGFVFTVVDLFVHDPRLEPPPDTAVPAQGSPVFEYLGKRFAASFGPTAFANAIKATDWVMANSQDAVIQLTPSLARRMVTQEWPAIRADIDNRRLAPLYLVMAPQGDPVTALGHSHQVLAYGYDLADDGGVTLHVYDPNEPDVDDSVVRFNVSDPSHAISIDAPGIEASFGQPETIRGVFRAQYTSADPSVLGLQPLADAGD
jgi:hypothetical protein